MRTRAGWPSARKNAAFTSWIGRALCGTSESYILIREQKEKVSVRAIPTPVLKVHGGLP